MDRFVYFVVVGLVSIIRLLPLSVCYVLGQGIGFLLWLFLPRYRRLASRNIASAFENEKSPAEVRALVLSHFLTIGANGASALKIAALPVEKVRECGHIEGLDIALAALKKGKGVIACINHMGNWELYAQLTSCIHPHRAGTVFQALRNPYLNDFIDRDRKRVGTLTFDRKKGFAGPLALLREGGMVGVLIDQHAGDSGVWTPLFNKLCSTSPLAAALATRTGAEVMPIAVYTVGFARWKIAVSPTIPYDPENPDKLTHDLNQSLERQVRTSPKDWFWVHNRWRVPEPRFLLSNVKRGTYLDKDDAAKLQPFRILIRSSNWLGDAVMSAPAVAAIKQGRPDMRLTILTPAKLVDFWKEVPAVDEIIPIEAKESVFRTAAKIRGKADVAIIFPNSTRSALEAYLAGIPRRVGCRGKFRSRLLNQIPADKKMKSIRPEHQSQHYLRLARWIGAPDVPVTAPAYTPPPSPPYRIGVCPGAEYGPAKRWLPGRFAETVRNVSAEAPVVWSLLGTAKDIPVTEEILNACPDNTIENLAGKTSLAQLIAHLKGLHLLITNDTGTMHLAAHLGVPAISIFGSTEPVLTGPLGPNQKVVRHQVECSPCFLRECPLDFRCMRAVEASEISHLALNFLGKLSFQST